MMDWRAGSSGSACAIDFGCCFGSAWAFEVLPDGFHPRRDHRTFWLVVSLCEQLDDQHMTPLCLFRSSDQGSNNGVLSVAQREAVGARESFIGFVGLGAGFLAGPTGTLIG